MPDLWTQIWRKKRRELLMSRHYHRRHDRHHPRFLSIPKWFEQIASGVAWYGAMFLPSHQSTVSIHKSCQSFVGGRVTVPDLLELRYREVSWAWMVSGRSSCLVMVWFLTIPGMGKSDWKFNHLESAFHHDDKINIERDERYKQRQHVHTMI